MKKELVNNIYTTLNGTGLFITSFKNYVPVYNSVSDFPAFAVVELEEERERTSVTGNKFDIHGLIGVYVYAKYPQDSYEDVISDLVDAVATAINQSTTLQAGVLDAYVMSVKRDGTLLYPYAMAEIMVYVNYRDIC